MDIEKIFYHLNELSKLLPDWASERRLTLLAGAELFAFKLPWSEWKIKEVRCNKCGQCCMTRPLTPWGVDDEGKCLKLEKQGDDWVCLGRGLLLNCFKDPNDEPECCIRYYKDIDHG